MAFGVLVLGLAFVYGYGYMADELYFLSCVGRLVWGYVDHPPFAVAVLGAFRAFFGDSLFAVRMIPALFSGATIFVLGLLVREMGSTTRHPLLEFSKWIPRVRGKAGWTR